jgi:hypothetical protein
MRKLLKKPNFRLERRTAEDILDENVEGYGEKAPGDCYAIDQEEFKILLATGGRLLVINKDRDDGTFSSDLEYQGRAFRTFTDEIASW